MQGLKNRRALNYEKIKKFSFDWGAQLFGVADISKIKEEFLLLHNAKGFNSAISLGARLSKAILDEITDHPTKLYFHHYRTVNFFLDQLGFRLSNYIQSQGFSALAIPASQIIDWEKQKAHLSHKKIGYLAGLGWPGLNNLLVNKDLGSQFRLVSILTDMPLKTDKPLADNCAKCRICIEVCPVKAIKEKREDFDHLACFEKLKEFKKQNLVGQYICGICVKACKGGK